MTDRDLRFADEYMIDFSPKHAAIRAGYSEKTARNASAWINAANPQKPLLRALIDRKLADMSRRTGITAERVLSELGNIAFANIDDVIDIKNGGFATDVQRTDMAAVAGYRVKRGDGFNEREIKMLDKLKALELIGKHLGMFTENVRANNETPNIVDDIASDKSTEVEAGAQCED